jgi:hypothetical protein
METDDGMVSAGETPNSSTRDLWQFYQQTKEMMNLDIELSLFTLPNDFSLAVKSNSFTSPPKGGVLRIFIALKNPSPSAGFKPANLGSDGKYASHYTTEDDCSFRTIGQLQWMPKTTRRPAGICMFLCLRA